MDRAISSHSMKLLKQFNQVISHEHDRAVQNTSDETVQSVDITETLTRTIHVR
jgi:hypothetical protein